MRVQRLDHYSIRTTDLAQLYVRATKTGVEFRERTVPPLDIHQGFFEDPRGVTLEPDFPATEASSARAA